MDRKYRAYLAKWEAPKRAAKARTWKEEQEQIKRNHEITLKVIDAQTKVLSEKYKAAGYRTVAAYRCCDDHDDYNHHHSVVVDRSRVGQWQSGDRGEVLDRRRCRDVRPGWDACHRLGPC